MNSRPLVLLDTSLQIERLMGAAIHRRAIEEQLATAAYHFVTSNYVFMEFQRSLLADYVRVYNTLRQYPVWEEAAYALRSGPLAYRSRALGRCSQILVQIMSLSQTNPDYALSLLKATIKYDLSARFWHRVEPLPDPIRCDLVAVGVRSHTTQRLTVADSCRKEQAACHLPDFLADHRVELQTIAAYLAAHPQVVKEQTRLERLVRTVIDDPRTALGQSSCWPLGDIIIALQALPDAQIWTIDADFQALAQALGLSLYAPALEKK